MSEHTFFLALTSNYSACVHTQTVAQVCMQGLSAHRAPDRHSTSGHTHWVYMTLEFESVCIYKDLCYVCKVSACMRESVYVCTSGMCTHVVYVFIHK